jgi:hypothetical protein
MISMSVFERGETVAQRMDRRLLDEHERRAFRRVRGNSRNAGAAY